MNGDLISRTALIKEYERLMTQTSECNKPVLQEHIDRITWQPAVDAEPVRHGRWIKIVRSLDDGDYYKRQCSECKWEPDDTLWLPKYCPVCGAKMEGED